MVKKNEWMAGLRKGLRFGIKYVVGHLVWDGIKHAAIWGWPYLVALAIWIGRFFL